MTLSRRSLTRSICTSGRAGAGAGGRATLQRMPRATLAVALVAGLVALGACSLAGLDGYSSGYPGADGGGDTSVSDVRVDGPIVIDAPACEGGYICAGQCVDVAKNPSHCGACGKTCAAGYGCANGVCGNVPVGIGGGAIDTCAVLAGGEVWCWGRDVWGEVGVDPSKANAACPFMADKCQTVPAKVVGVTDAVSVAMGSEAACALQATGAVTCWGSNLSDQLGHDPATDATCTKAGGPNSGQQGPCSYVPKPVALPGGVVAKKLAFSSYTGCILSTAGDVYCWGTNRDGEIKSPVGGKEWQPTKRASGATDVSVSSSAENFSTICVVGAGGVTSCWGQASDDPTLGPGYSFFPTSGAVGCQFDRCDPTAHVIPTNFQSQTGQVLADSVAVGYFAACALQGSVALCWGHDGYGQRGNGTTAAALFDPVAPVGVPALSAVSNLGLTTALLDATGQVWMFGWNATGQIGDGTYGGTPCAGPGGGNCVTSPKKIPALTNVSRVSSALTGAVALTVDHKVLTWGANYTGELGHAPGGVGDGFCPGAATYYCNPTPTVVQGLP